MKKIIKRKIESLLIKTRIVNLFENGIPCIGHIIELHRVTSHSNILLPNTNLAISPEFLEEIIRFFIEKNYSFISLDDFYHRNWPEPKEKFVVFTFDDGYKDNFTTALPLFTKYAIPFTIYVCSGFPDQTAILWWYIIEDILLNNENISFYFRKNNYEFSAVTLQEKEEVFKILHKIFLLCTEDELNDLSVSFFDKYTDFHKKILEVEALSWEQITFLSDSPLVTIGCHGINHIPITNLNANQIKKELTGSKSRIENVINTKVEHLSFPYGKIPKDHVMIKKILNESGFKTAVVGKTGNITGNSKFDNYNLPRISIQANESFQLLRLKTSNTIFFLEDVFNSIILRHKI